MRNFLSLFQSNRFSTECPKKGWGWRRLSIPGVGFDLGAHLGEGRVVRDGVREEAHLRQGGPSGLHLRLIVLLLRQLGDYGRGSIVISLEELKVVILRLR